MYACMYVRTYVCLFVMYTCTVCNACMYVCMLICMCIILFGRLEGIVNHSMLSCSFGLLYLFFLNQLTA